MCSDWRLPLLVLQHPLLVKEWFNSCHLDVWLSGCIVWALAVPAGLGALWVGLGMNVKPIPVALLAIQGFRPRAAAIFLAASILPWIFFARGIADYVENLFAFAEAWEMNSGVFRWVREAFYLLPLEPGAAGWLARAAVAVSWLTLVAAVWKRSGLDTIEKLFWSLFSLVVLSPVANPWYFTWSLPLAARLPEPRRLPALCLFAWLPLSYAFYLPAGEILPVERWWDAEHLGMAAVLAIYWSKLEKMPKTVLRGTLPSDATA